MFGNIERFWKDANSADVKITRSGALTGVGSLLVVIAGLAGAALYVAGEVTGNDSLTFAGAILLTASLAVFVVITPILSVANLASAMARAGATTGTIAKTLVSSGSEVIGNTKAAGVFGLVVSIGIIWDFFIYETSKNNSGPGTLTFDALLATAIASTLVAILLFALSLSSVGFILVSMVSAIDLFAFLFCSAGVSGACFSILGALTQEIARGLLDSDVILDTERDDLVNVDVLDMQLANSRLGLRAGNAISHYAIITSNIFHKSGVPYDYRDEHNIPSTTMRYELDNRSEPMPKVDRHEMADEWENVRKILGSDHYQAENTTRVQTDSRELVAGINQAEPLWLNLSYAFPAYSCWKAGLLGRFRCDGRTIRGTTETDLGSSSMLDIFPFSGGFDLNDTTPDWDGDGVPDGAELKYRTNPRSADSDNDGLSDGLELILGTDPGRKDSDRDGLSDQVEVEGWLFTYGTGKSVHIASNPLRADSDGDGLEDRAEKEIFHANPQVFNTDTIGISTTVDDPDLFVGLGQAYVYTATVSNNFVPGAYDVGVIVAAGGTITSTFSQRLGGVSVADDFFLSEGESVFLVIHSRLA